MKKILYSASLVLLLAVVACGGSKAVSGRMAKNEGPVGSYASLAMDNKVSVVPLRVSFQQGSSWNGRAIPGAQLCKREGGLGLTPPLVVENIPEGTNVLIVAYDDVESSNLEDNGWQGKIGYHHDGKSSKAVLMPIDGQSSHLPPGAFKEAPAKIEISGGATYMPPCGSPRGKTYVAKVYALNRTSTYQEIVSQCKAGVPCFYESVQWRNKAQVLQEAKTEEQPSFKEEKESKAPKTSPEIAFGEKPVDREPSSSVSSKIDSIPSKAEQVPTKLGKTPEPAFDEFLDKPLSSEEPKVAVSETPKITLKETAPQKVEAKTPTAQPYLPKDAVPADSDYVPELKDKYVKKFGETYPNKKFPYPEDAYYPQNGQARIGTEASQAPICKDCGREMTKEEKIRDEYARKRYAQMFKYPQGQERPFVMDNSGIMKHPGDVPVMAQDDFYKEKQVLAEKEQQLAQKEQQLKMTAEPSIPVSEAAVSEAPAPEGAKTLAVEEQKQPKVLEEPKKSVSLEPSEYSKEPDEKKYEKIPSEQRETRDEEKIAPKLARKPVSGTEDELPIIDVVSEDDEDMLPPKSLSEEAVMVPVKVTRFGVKDVKVLVHQGKLENTKECLLGVGAINLGKY